MPRFLIVDDHYIFRQGVKKIISDEFGEALFGEAANSAEASAKLHTDQWDLMILDINMPGRSGLDLLSDAQTYNSKIPILILSMYEEDQMALRALKAGAKGYMCKGRVANELIIAVRRILEGKEYLSDNVAKLLVSEYRNEKSSDKISILSDREYFVLLRLAAGETVTEISNSMSLSVKTISTYRSRLMKKLNLNNTAQLISFVKENNLG